MMTAGGGVGGGGSPNSSENLIGAKGMEENLIAFGKAPWRGPFPHPTSHRFRMISHSAKEKYFLFSEILLHSASPPDRELLVVTYHNMGPLFCLNLY